MSGGGGGVTPSERDFLEGLALGLSSVSLALCVPVIATNIVMKPRRKFPANVVTILALSCAAFYVLLLTGYAAKSYIWQCVPSESERECVGCLVQAFMFQFLIIFMNTWWYGMVLVLYRVVHQKWSVSRIKKSRKLLHLICFAVSLILAIPPLIFGKYGRTHFPWCWIPDSPPNSSTNTYTIWQFSVLYIPMGIILAAGLPLVYLSARKLIMTSCPVSKAQLQEVATRQLIFAAFMGTAFSIAISTAVLRTFESVPSFANLLTTLIAVCSIGIFFFCTLGLKKDNIAFWCRNKKREESRGHTSNASPTLVDSLLGDERRSSASSAHAVKKD